MKQTNLPNHRPPKHVAIKIKDWIWVITCLCMFPNPCNPKRKPMQSLSLTHTHTVLHTWQQENHKMSVCVCVCVCVCMCVYVYVRVCVCFQLLSWMFQHACLDTWVLSVLYACVLYLPLFSAIEHVSHGKALYEIHSLLLLLLLLRRISRTNSLLHFHYDWQRNYSQQSKASILGKVVDYMASKNKHTVQYMVHNTLQCSHRNKKFEGDYDSLTTIFKSMISEGQHKCTFYTEWKQQNQIYSITTCWYVYPWTLDTETSVTGCLGRGSTFVNPTAASLGMGGNTGPHPALNSQFWLQESCYV